MNTRWMAAILGLTTLFSGCGESAWQDAGTGSVPFVLPDFAAGGKADGGNVSFDSRLERGEARNGQTAGYVALPLRLKAEEPLLVQAWTSAPSVVFVYGPKGSDPWDMEQVRQFSKNLEPGVDSQFFQLEPAETGEYLLVIGALDGSLTDWIVAWADESLSLD